MAKRRKKSEEQVEQLSLFEIEDNLNSEQLDDSDDDWLQDDDYGFGSETSDRTIEAPAELLTLKLLREAIQAQNPNDQVMLDFAEYVLPNLLRSGNWRYSKRRQIF
jgi:CRISPR-associated protein Csc3